MVTTPFPKSTNNSAKKKKITFYTILILFWSFLIFGIYYGYYKYSLRGLQFYTETELPNPPKLSNQDILNLGWAQIPKDKPVASYLDFSEKKSRKNIYRIGFFGCSTVRGSEVSDSLNFVELVNRQLRALKIDSIECINFGVGGYGMHQSYLLYKTLGVKYNLDMVVFNPYKFHDERDLSFRLYNCYPYIHSRYIIENNSLKLISPYGETKKEIVENYYDFIPNNIYLNYDLKAPNYLKPFYGTKINPRYYRENKENSTQDEITEIYCLMIKDMIKDGKKVIFINNDSHTDSLKIKMKDKKFELWNNYPKNRFVLNCFYIAPMQHLSGVANDLKAKIITQNILHQKSEVKTIRLKTINDNSIEKINDDSKITDKYLTFGNHGGIYHLFLKNDYTWENTQPIDLKNTKEITHLILISGKDSFPEFLLLKNKPNKISLQFQFEDESMESIDLEISGNRFITKILGIKPSPSIQYFKKEGIGLNNFNFKTSKKMSNVKLVVDEYSYDLEVRIDKKNEFFTLYGAEFCIINSAHEQYVNVENLQQQGALNFYVETQNKKYFLPILNYEIVTTIVK